MFTDYYGLTSSAVQMPVRKMKRAIRRLISLSKHMKNGQHTLCGIIYDFVQGRMGEDDGVPLADQLLLHLDVEELVPPWQRGPMLERLLAAKRCFTESLNTVAACSRELRHYNLSGLLAAPELVEELQPMLR